MPLIFITVLYVRLWCCGLKILHCLSNGNCNYLYGMKMILCAITVCLFFFSCTKSSNSTTPVTPPDTTTVDNDVHLTYRGADLSFLPEIEQAGTKFYDSTGAVKPALQIFKDYGCNLVRVRLWYNPATQHSSLAEVLTFCKQIRDAGLQILLDFHYSDTWADPGQQAIPAAWSALTIDVLKDSVKTYTQRVVGLLKAQNTLPAIIQVGNEINNGIMWPAGKVSGITDANWTSLIMFIKSGIEGIKAIDTHNSVAIMLHYAQTDGVQDFFNKMVSQGISFDIAGLSYYPWWGVKDLTTLQQQLNNLATLGKKIMVVETAYPFTLQWNDNTNNTVGDVSQLLPAFPASFQGQLAYLLQLKKMIAAIPGQAGIGFCYWAPDWVAFKGTSATDGSNAENLAQLGFDNRVLISLRAYKK